ncbi:MAG: hypothetical protein MdMp014T_2179 [Treponematales bacterium]
MVTGMTLRRAVLAALALAAAVLAAGCRGREVPRVEREDRFSLNFGAMEDEIVLSPQGWEPLKINLAMRGRFFYISDGSGGKVVRYTSSGDPLFMVYNEETNPPPALIPPLKDGVVSTRWSVSFPFSEPGLVAVDSRNHVYVEDELPYERRSMDTESGVLLGRVVLHFDDAGRFVEYLGQEGSGGTPFPVIEGIYTSGEETVVVCRFPRVRTVHWFDADGRLRYMAQLEDGALPLPPGAGEPLIAALDRIAAAPDSRRLFVKVNYYRNTEAAASLIWMMNIEDGSYGKPLNAPLYEYTPAGNRRDTFKVFYSLAGVSGKGRAFLLAPVEGGYSILILGPGIERRGFLQADNEELLFSKFDVSPDGILSAALADEWKVKIVWWRTDKLTGEAGP